MAMLNNQRVFVLEYLKSSHELAESTAIKKKASPEGKDWAIALFPLKDMTW